MEKPQAPIGIAHFDKVAATYAGVQDTSPMVKIAREILSLTPPITSQSVVLDNASGPGIVTSEIVRQAKPGELPEIFAADLSPNMIEMVQKKNWPRVNCEVMDAQELSYADSTFTHSFMSMGIFLLPEPERGAREIYRTLKPGGVAALTSIREVGWVRLFQMAQKAVKPEEPAWGGPLAPEWSTAEKLLDVVQAGGFREDDIEIKTTKATQPSNLLSGFLDTMKVTAGEMITKSWEDDEKEKFWVALDEQIHAAILNPFELEVCVWIAVAKK